MSILYCARAPVRVDPAGGGCDAPPYCIDFGGTVVNIAIAHYVHATLRIREHDPRVVIHGNDLNLRAEATHLDAWTLDGTLDLLKAIAIRLRPRFGFELTVSSDVPPGSGLGSSGAVGAAVTAVFDAAMGITRSQADTAELANDIERSDLHSSGGSQDSYGAALPGVKRIEYHPGGGLDVEVLQLPPEVRLEWERRSVLVYTGQIHLSHRIHDDIWTQYADPHSSTRDALHNLARIGRACAHALARADLSAYAQALSENWVHHQRLHDSCSSRRLLAFYEVTRGLVEGGKTCGAGGGGCILFLAREGRRRDVEAACRDFGGTLLPVRMDTQGVVSWTHATPPGIEPGSG